MKSKFSKILGVALPLAMVIALAVMLLPAASTPTTEAAEGTLRFGVIPLPRYVEDGGRYVLVHDNDVGPIAVTPQGNILFASANVTAAYGANLTDLLKSGDDGYTWTLQPGFRTAASANSSSIVAIAASPEYATDSTLFVATERYIYQSVDGGTTFTPMSQSWAAGETITDMDITLDSSGRLSVIVGTTAAANAGEVYVYSPATTGMTWTAQLIGARNVLAVAFSPNFASDEGIVAVTVTGTDTRTQFAFGSTQLGGAWGTSIGDATFVDSQANPFVSTRARIAFPDDFDVDSLASNIAFVGLSANATDTALEQGDVYEVIFQPGTRSTAVDLNVRGLISQVRTATNIHSIDVTGDAEAATIVVGTDFWTTGAVVGVYYWSSYISTDSGVTWTSARTKSPTGGTPTWNPAWAPPWTTNSELVQGADVNCNVLLAPDFATSGKAYAGTTGADTSAFQRSTDSGKSFNQISFIDYSDNATVYFVNTFSAQSDWAESKTALMSTAITADPFGLGQTGSGGSCWKTTDGGAHWDRIWSYANPTATQTIDGVSRAYAEANIGETVFAKDPLNGQWWRSSDYGATFPRPITHSKETFGQFLPGLVGSFEITPDMIWTWFWNNNIWTTTDLRFWDKPDESIITGIPIFYALSAGGLTLVPTIVTGEVYVSQDGGVTFTKKLGVADPGGGGAPVWTDTDANYAENKYVYASLMAAGGGIWRIEVDEESPESTEWVRIDETSVNNTGFTPSLIMHKAGVTYVWSSNAVDTARSVGGFWRSLNPEADLTGANPPVFTIVNTGLVVGDTLGYKSWSDNPTTIFFGNTAAANYYDQVVAYKDILSTAVALTEPANKLDDAGIALSTTDLTKDMILRWGIIAGAQQYQWEVCNDEGCDSVAQTGTTAGTEVRIQDLIPGKTYYWRVRVDTPLLTPWSEVRNFTIGEREIIGAPEVVVEFDVVSPGRGDSGVPVQPVFVWTEVEGAESYELVVAEDKTFAIIEWSHTADTSFYQGDEVLAYGTTYYWRVRAPKGEWANGVFTTVQKAVAEEPAVVIEKEPAPPAEIVQVEVPGAPAAIPSYLLWTIIGVGAVLVIALIVLIVRTRRVT